jgi:predicted nucleic acid-binding protein
VTRTAGPFTVDASVFLSAFTPNEPGHRESLRFLQSVRERAVAVVVPTLLLPEVAGAVGRKTRDADLARRFASTLRRLPHLILISLDARLAIQAATLAAASFLRGSDAVYAAVAAQFGSTLITLDQDQERRVAEVVRTRRPGELKFV